MAIAVKSQQYALVYNTQGYFWLSVEGKIKMHVYNTHAYCATLSHAAKKSALHGDYMGNCWHSAGNCCGRCGCNRGVDNRLTLFLFVLTPAAHRLNSCWWSGWSVLD